MANSHKGKARDLSTHEADIDGSQSSLVDSLAQLDTTQGGTVEAKTVAEETRTHLKAVPDLTESEVPAPAAPVVKAEEVAPKAQKEEKAVEPEKPADKPADEPKAKKEEVKKSPADLLAQLVEVVEGIDNMDALEEFARDCKHQGLLTGGIADKGWWVKPFKDSENSKVLVDAIMKKKGEFIEKARIAGQIRKIEGFTDLDELRKHVQALKHFKYIKIGAKGEPIVDEQVPGSKEIVEALNKQRAKILAADDEKRGLENLANKYKK